MKAALKLAHNDDPLTPCDIDTVWDEARPLLADALDGSDDCPEDIKQLCERGEVLFLASPIAFVALQKVPAPTGFDIVIWAAVSRGDVGCVKTHLHEVEKLAICEGARYLTFYTTHRGFSRLMPDDWHIKHYMWAKRLH